MLASRLRPQNSLMVLLTADFLDELEITQFFFKQCGYYLFQNKHFFDRNCHVFNTFLSPDLIATKKWSAKKKTFRQQILCKLQLTKPAIAS